MTTERHRQSR